MAKGLAGPIYSTVEEEVRGYLIDVMSRLGAAPGPGEWLEQRESLAEEIFAALTDRGFSHLSRNGAAPFRAKSVALLEERIRGGEPIPFWYDVGPGYHASTRVEERDLSFDVGLSELLILSQIVSFCNRVAALYPPGARFWLIVDNLCALRTNDIPVERTAAYCAAFRTLIRELRLEDRVAIIVESEEFDLAEYDRLLAEVEAQPLPSPPTEDEIENVDRFLGRHCSPEEAAERIDNYRRTCIVTEHLLTRVVRGVRMTQRATKTTLGFRPFVGSDSRTQCGEVALTRNATGKLRPVLLTSRNIDSYHCTRFSSPDKLASLISHVTYAERRE